MPLRTSEPERTNEPVSEVAVEVNTVDAGSTARALDALPALLNTVGVMVTDEAGAEDSV